MDWWAKLKGVVAGSSPPPRKRSEERIATAIKAYCEPQDDFPMSVEVRSLSVSGMMLRARRGLRMGETIFLTLPVGKDFQDRETIEHIGFSARVVWSRQASESVEYDIGVQYVDSEHARRDRWITLVMETYGMRLLDDRRVRGLRHQASFPIILRAADGSGGEGTLRNISLGGLMATLDETLAVAPGIEVEIELRPPRTDMQLHLKGRVVVVHADRKGRLCHGVVLHELQDPQREAILDALIALTRDPPASIKHRG